MTKVGVDEPFEDIALVPRSRVLRACVLATWPGRRRGKGATKAARVGRAPI